MILGRADRCAGGFGIWRGTHDHMYALPSLWQLSVLLWCLHDVHSWLWKVVTYVFKSTPVYDHPSICSQFNYSTGRIWTGYSLWFKNKNELFGLFWISFLFIWGFWFSANPVLVLYRVAQVSEVPKVIVEIQVQRYFAQHFTVVRCTGSHFFPAAHKLWNKSQIASAVVGENA